MKKKLFDTTFGKLTFAYLLFGVIPLFLLSILFFSRFTDNIRTTMIRNYAQINGYFARNVGDIMESADSAMSELYDYETDDGESLAVVLKDPSLSDGERALEVVNALNKVMAQSKHIASTRFVDMNGQIYSVYYNQEKPCEMMHSIIRRCLLYLRINCGIFVCCEQQRKAISVLIRTILFLYWCAIIWTRHPWTGHTAQLLERYFWISMSMYWMIW